MVTDEQIAFGERLPDEPSAGFRQWAEKKVDFNVIVYKVAWAPDYVTGMRQKMIECRCTACGGVFYQQYAVDPLKANYHSSHIAFYDEHNEIISDGSHCLCPNCGAEVRAFHVSSFRREYELVIEALNAVEMCVVGSAPVMIEWNVRKLTNKAGQTRTDIRRSEAYAFIDKRIYRYCGYKNGFFGSYYYFVPDWIPRARFDDGIRQKGKEDIYPVDKGFLDGTVLENAKFQKYIRESSAQCYPLTYLRTYIKHRNVENLVMQGLSNFVNQLIYANSGGSYYSAVKVRMPKQGVDWKKKKPHEMLSLTKEEFDYVKKAKWHLDDIEFYKFTKKIGCNVKIQDFKKEFKGFSESDVSSIVSFAPEVSPMKILRYFKKQKKKYSASWWVLIDYYRMQNQLEEEKDYFPQNVRRAHDQLQQRLDEIKYQKYTKEFNEAAEKYKSFEFHKDGLFIRIATAPSELSAEGKALSHCVASYISTHAAGTSHIFFIRKEAEPDKPFYTLELSTEKLNVIQNRGLRNCDRTEEVTAFEEEWLEFIKEVTNEHRGIKRKTACA